jgi:uncharacterized phage-like protein YoqJ
MLRLTLKEALRQKEDIEVISGMALGVDQWWAKAALDLGIPYHAYIPFKGQESRWPEQSVKGFEHLLLNAKDMKIVCEGGYAPWKMQKRNEAMVDDAEVCVAVWDGTKGGTGNCVEYIIKQGKPLFLIDPVERKRSWYVG